MSRLFDDDKSVFASSKTKKLSEHLLLFGFNVTSGNNHAEKLELSLICLLPTFLTYEQPCAVSH